MVYFILDLNNSCVKIGKANNPKRRLTELQISNINTLTIILTENGGVKREKELHSKFRRYNTRGEWFDISGRNNDLLSYINNHSMYHIECQYENNKCYIYEKMKK